jgi:hypothetical protein
LSRKTESEEAFEGFCFTHGISLVRLDPSDEPGVRTPDYEIATADGPVVVEVKQYDPNREDIENARLLEARGYGKAVGGEPGAKARKKIDSGARQLKTRSRGQVPTLLVLYNNIPYNFRGIDPYEIKAAMYGMEKVDLLPSHDRITVLDRGFGPKRRVAPSRNTSLSAVGTLRESWEGELWLLVYHNIYATKPLRHEGLAGPRIAHFTLETKAPRQFQEWRPLDPLPTD